MKSRTLAQKLVEGGSVRLNSVRCKEPDARIGAGDVLTITVGKRLLVWKVLACGERRGPPAEAQGLYDDLSPTMPPREA